MRIAGKARAVFKEQCEVEVQENFDIYSELLGVPPGPRPPDYYRLLGVPLYEPDASRVHAAARQLIARLAPQLAGKHAAQVQQLMGEIATARAALTTPTVKVRYDAKLREQSDGQAAGPPMSPAEVEALMPPMAVDPRQLKQTVAIRRQEVADDEPLLIPTQSPRWARQVTAPPPPPDVPAAGPALVKAKLVAGPGAAFTDQLPPPAVVPSAALSPPVAIPPYDALPPTVSEPSFLPPPAQPPETWPGSAPPPMPTGLDSMLATDASRARVSNSRPKSSSQAALIVALVCLVMIVGTAAGLALYMQSRSLARAEAVAGAERVAGRANSDKSAPVSAKADSTRGQTPVSAERGRASPIVAERRAPESSSRGANSPRERLASSRTEQSVSANKPVTPAAPAVSQPAPPPAMPEMKGDDAQMRAKTDPPPENRPDPAVNAAQEAAVRKSLQAARQALVLRHLDEADEQLDLATLDASNEALAALVEREKALRHYVGGFWNAVRESTKTLESGTDLALGEETIGIVEISDDRERLVIRDAGQNQDYTISQLPTKVAVGLAERWLEKDDVNSKAFVGAFLMLDARGNPQRGRRLLEEAKAAGSDAAASVLADLGSQE